MRQICHVVYFALCLGYFFRIVLLQVS